MKTRRASILQDCLSRIADGENPDDVLDSYPDDREFVAPLLMTALGLQRGRKLAAPADFRKRTYENIVSEDGEDRRRSGSQVPWFAGAWLAQLFARPTRVALVSIVLVLALGGFAAAVASADSRPGDLLYPVRQLTESIRDTAARSFAPAMGWLTDGSEPTATPTADDRHPDPQADSSGASVGAADSTRATIVRGERPGATPTSIVVTAGGATATTRSSATSNPLATMTLDLPTASPVPTETLAPPTATPSPTAVPATRTDAPSPPPQPTDTREPTETPVPTATPPAPSCRGKIEGAVSFDGAPMAGAQVDVVEIGSGMPSWSGATGGDGKYAAVGLCADVYVVLATVDDGPTMLAGFCDGDGNGDPDTVPLPTDDSTIRDVNIILQEVTPPTQCQGGVSGFVTFEGAPVVGAGISVVTSLGQVRLFGATGGDGSYQAVGLCAGEYIVRASHIDGPRMLEGYYDADGNGEPDLVSLPDDNAAVTNIDITLKDVTPPIQCLGTVSGRVSDEAGAPAVGAAVVLALDGLVPVDQVETGSAGSYGFEMVCPGTYQVHATLTVGGGVLTGYFDSDGDQVPDGVPVHDTGPPVESIDIELAGLGQASQSYGVVGDR